VQPLPSSWKGAILSHGINPLFGALDPYDMAMLAVDEALRNLVASGGSIDHAAILDNFCWGAVDEPEQLGGLVRAAQGCRDAVSLYQVPFICGKDSLRNTSSDDTGTHSIPGTLLISAVGVVEDVRRCVTSDLKSAGSLLYMVGITADELGASHLHLIEGRSGGKIPAVRPEAPAVMRRLSDAVQAGLVQSCHDLSEGGLAVAAAEMAIAGGLGLNIDLNSIPCTSPLPHDTVLFAESSGRFLVEVNQELSGRFEELVAGFPCRAVGEVVSGDRFVLASAEAVVVNLSLADLTWAWHTPLAANDVVSAASNAHSFTKRPSSSSFSGSISTARIHIYEPPQTRPVAPALLSQVRAMVLAAPGINCDAETIRALSLAGADPELVRVKELLEGRRHFDEFKVLVIPGGFSYGDHLGAGSMLATVLQHRCLEELRFFAASGRPLIGICNGFQVLARLGFLGPMALSPNAQRKFECCWVPLRANPSMCSFFEGLDEVELPVAHGEGRVVIPRDHLPDALMRAPLLYRHNPNGSAGDIAALCSDQGNVLGMMPHPERYVSSLQHPHRAAGKPAGLAFFENVVCHAERL
jgi:phosphoribosylformylglycinamidine synthase